MSKDVSNKNEYVTSFIRAEKLTVLNKLIDSVGTELSDYATFGSVTPEMLYSQVSTKYKDFLAQSKDPSMAVAAVGDKWRGIMLQVKKAMDSSEVLKRADVWTSPMTHATMSELVTEKDKHLKAVIELIRELRALKAEDNHGEFVKVYARYEKELKTMRALERVIALFHTTVDEYSKSSKAQLEPGTDYEISEIEKAYEVAFRAETKN